MNGSFIGPVNLGNPEEYTIMQLAQTVQRMVNPDAKVEFKEVPSDDPRRRKPDISKAIKHFDWKPTIGLEEGLTATIADFRSRLASGE